MAVAVAVAVITPGPVVITMGFIDYLVAGFWGAAVATVGTFVPCYLLTILPVLNFKKHGKRPGIVAFVDGSVPSPTGSRPRCRWSRWACRGASRKSPNR